MSTKVRLKEELASIKSDIRCAMNVYDLGDTCDSINSIDNALRLMIQCARHGTLKLPFEYIKSQGMSGTAFDSDGVEHRRGTVKSWGARRMFDVEWHDGDGCKVAHVTLTKEGAEWLTYLREMLNEAPL